MVAGFEDDEGNERVEGLDTYRGLVPWLSIMEGRRAKGLAGGLGGVFHLFRSRKVADTLQRHRTRGTASGSEDIVGR